MPSRRAIRAIVLEFVLPFIAGVLLALSALSWGQQFMAEWDAEEAAACQDVLALQHPHFPARQLAALLPEGACGGNLDWSFGAGLGNIRRVLETGKIILWRVHMFNGPGLRNGRLGRYEPHARHSISSFNVAWERGGDRSLRRHLRRRVKRYCNLFSRFPGARLEISPTLEHNLSRRAFRGQVEVVSRACPRAVVVDNPVGGVASSGLKGVKIERHGTAASGLKAPCNVSLDGDDAHDVNVSAYLRKNPSCVHYLWTHAYNGRFTESQESNVRGSGSSEAWNKFFRNR